MKVESKVTEKVTKEEKVLTISESEFKDVVRDVAKSMIEENIEHNFNPIVRLALLTENATFCGKLHEALFKGEENKTNE